MPSPISPFPTKPRKSRLRLGENFSKYRQYSSKFSPSPRSIFSETYGKKLIGDGIKIFLIVTGSSICFAALPVHAAHSMHAQATAAVPTTLHLYADTTTTAATTSTIPTNIPTSLVSAATTRSDIYALNTRFTPVQTQTAVEIAVILGLIGFFLAEHTALRSVYARFAGLLANLLVVGRKQKTSIEPHMHTIITRLLGYVLCSGALILAATIFYRNSSAGDSPLIFSPVQLLNATWLSYKSDYLEPGTYRTVDTGRGDVTTSEGQSYTMLRAVWMDDKQTFDGAWTWTQANIYHTGDHLFAWLWGKKAYGSYGVITAQNGETSASDADTDIALSLIFAYARWQDPKYLDTARALVQDIWNKEVIEAGGTYYLAADDLESNPSAAWAIINLSYLNPAAYRIFAHVDRTHPWNTLVESSYALLARSVTLPLDRSQSANLPPDWIELHKTTGALRAVPSTGADTTDFGFDAMRVPFNLALDWEWFKDSRDIDILRQFSFLSSQWNEHKKLASTYAHDGRVVVAGEAPSIYGGTIGYFLLAASSTAPSVYRQKLAFLYNPGANTWKKPLSYYDDNWAWFGIALYNNMLPNLTADIPVTAFNQ